MNCSFKIIITKTNTIKCSIRISNEKERYITLYENVNEYPISIEFNSNEIIVCQNQRKESETIEFFDEWIHNPIKYQKYSFQFQGNNYETIAETFFALIISEFTNKISKNCTIDKTIVILPTNNHTFIKRMKFSLESIGLMTVIFNNENYYDYSEDKQLLNDLLHMKEKYTKDKNKIQRVKQTENISRIIKIDILCAFITSKYFETLTDYFNYSFVSKRFRSIMEMYHYNPISLNEKTIRYFPNLTIYHRYKESDIYLSHNKINQYIDWIPTTYSKGMEKMKEKQRK